MTDLFKIDIARFSQNYKLFGELASSFPKK